MREPRKWIRQMRRLFAAIIDKKIKLRNRHIFHCKMLGYIFSLYSTLRNSKWSLYFFFFSNSRWSMVAIFFISAFKKLAEHSNVLYVHDQLMWNRFLVYILQWHDYHAWKLHLDRLFDNLIFRYSILATQIYKHDVHEYLWKNLFHRTWKTLEAKFVTFFLSLFKLQTWLLFAFVRYLLECYGIRIMTRTFEVMASSSLHIRHTRQHATYWVIRIFLLANAWSVQKLVYISRV